MLGFICVKSAISGWFFVDLFVSVSFILDILIGRSTEAKGTREFIYKAGILRSG